MVKIAFDVDNTLIVKSNNGEDVPNYGVIHLIMTINVMVRDVDLIVWSGSGVDYARRWTEKLGIAEATRVIGKGQEKVDIAFDDEEVLLGKVNLQTVEM